MSSGILTFSLQECIMMNINCSFLPLMHHDVRAGAGSDHQMPVTKRPQHGEEKERSNSGISS